MNDFLFCPFDGTRLTQTDAHAGKGHCPVCRFVDYGNPAPADHSYYTRTVTNTVPSAFLYLPTQEEKK